MKRTHSIVVLTTVLLAVFIGQGNSLAAPATGDSFAPRVDVTEMHLVITGLLGADKTVFHRKTVDRSRVMVIPFDTKNGMPQIIDSIKHEVRMGDGYPGSVPSVSIQKGIALASPDGNDQLDVFLFNELWPLIAMQRNGKSVFSVVTVGGKKVLRGQMALSANDCAGLSAGTRAVELNPNTFIPTRITERRGGKYTMYETFSRRGASSKDFTPMTNNDSAPKITTTTSENDFTRSTISQAKTAVPFAISMPSVTPSGFTLHFTGTGKKGSVLGPEGSFPQSTSLFQARWVRGFEHVDFTIRPATSTLADDWDNSSPFGGECSSAKIEDVTSGGKTFHYLLNEFGQPGMWWRDGNTLYTLSGSVAKSTLATMAASLVVQ